MFSEDQKNKIIAIVQDLPIEVLYLFGSQATGHASLSSDYDFGVVFANGLDKKTCFDMRLQLIGIFTDILNKKVDVLDLLISPIRFQYEAIKPRMDIYVKNKLIRDDFENLILRDYLDQMYYLKKTTKDYLHQFATN